LKMRSLLFFLFLAVLAVLPVAAAEKPDPEQVVRAAVARHARDYDAQAEELAWLAWPETPGDPAVQALARKRLVGYGKNAIRPVRIVFGSLPAAYRADAVNAVKEAFTLVTSDLPVEYLQVMYEAAWFGPKDARLAAIPVIRKYRFKRPLLPLIDATYEDPSFTPVVIDTLGAIGDPRARFWLGEKLTEDDGAYRDQAARALSLIGGEALAPLKAGLESEDRALRERCAQALSTSAGSAELTALYQYLENYPDDDPETVEAIRSRAELLERALQELDEELSSSGEPEL